MTSEYEVKAAFQTQYDYLGCTEIEQIYATALNTYLDLAFPLQHDVVNVPVNRPRAWQWIYDCMVEILERSGCSSMTAYSENGLSISWDNTGLSNSLRGRIIPMVGVPR